MESIQKIESSIGEIDSLPTLSNVAARINKEIQNPRTTADQIGKIVSNDQSLTLSIMKLVNSAFYGFPRKINTISHAVAILGFNTIKNLVLTTSLLTSLKCTIDSPFFDQRKFWMHSLAVGSFAKAIGEEAKFNKPEEVFLSGVIHDIGKIILFSTFTSDFEKALFTADQKKTLLIDAENEVFGYNHTEVGYWITDKWQLPEYLSHVVLNHHTPEKSLDYHTICTIVQLADIMVRGLELGNAGDPVNQTILESNWESLNIKQERLAHILTQGQKEYEKASLFMQLV